jgi:hypothetical protein
VVFVNEQAGLGPCRYHTRLACLCSEKKVEVAAPRRGNRHASRSSRLNCEDKKGTRYTYTKFDGNSEEE